MLATDPTVDAPLLCLHIQLKHLLLRSEAVSDGALETSDKYTPIARRQAAQRQMETAVALVQEILDQVQRVPLWLLLSFAITSVVGLIVLVLHDLPYTTYINTAC